MRYGVVLLLAAALIGCVSTVHEVPRAEDPVPAETPSPMAVPPEQLEMDDEEIHDRVHTALENEPRLDAEDIAVRVDGGVVHLSGEVPSSELRALAVTLARDVAGVRTVEADDLEVR